MAEINIDLTGLPFVTNKVYYKYYFNKDRYLIIKGGAGSGKSHFVAQKLLMRTLAEPRSRILVVRKVKTTIRKSVWQLFQDLVSEYNWGHVFRFYKSEFTIKCPANGSEIWCVGLDDREKIKSIAGITSEWIEEITELSEEDFDQLDLRLRGRSESYHQIIGTFNPISPTHWLKKRFWHGVEEEKEEIFRELVVDVPGEGKKKLTSTLVTTGYRHNRFIDSIYRAKLESLKRINPEYYRVYALGHWGALDTVIYNQPKVISAESWNQIRFDQYFYGLDFGYTDPCVFMECAMLRISPNEIFEREIIYKSHLTTEELGDKIAEYLQTKHGDNWKFVPVYADAAEPDRIKTLKQKGINVKAANKAKHSIVDGIIFRKNFKFYVHEDSTNTIDEYGGYCWAVDKDGNVMDVPVDFFNHAMDALRYAQYTHLWAGGKTSYVGETSRMIY